MAYDEAKDVSLFHAALSTGLQVGVFQYDGGEPKMQLGPRVIERNGKEVRLKAGRLSFVEVKELVDLAPDLKKVFIKNRPKPKE